MQRMLLALFANPMSVHGAMRDLERAGFPRSAIWWLPPGAASVGSGSPPPDLMLAPWATLDLQRRSYPGDEAVTTPRSPGPEMWREVAGRDLAHCRRRVGEGMGLLAMRPEGREILAGEILRRHGGEVSNDRNPGRWRESMNGHDSESASVDLVVGGMPVAREDEAAEEQGDVALGPADPHRESDEGQPFLDDANPYGRPLANQQGQPLGGSGTGQFTDPVSEHLDD
jgi:hypothetical protein